MGEEYYLFLSSDDSKETYPSNSPCDFTVILPRRITLTDGDWHCALLETTFSSKKTGYRPLLFLCDIVRESYVSGGFSPVLNILHHTYTSEAVQIYEMTNPLYHPICRNYVDSLHISIKEDDGLQQCTDLEGPLRCLLHIKRVN